MFFDKKLIHFCLFLGLTNNFCRCWHRYDLKWKLCSWYSAAFLSSFQCFFPGKFEILCLRLSTPSHLWSCTFCRLSKLLLQINHWGRHKSTREIARKWFQQQKLPISSYMHPSVLFPCFLYCITKRAHWWEFPSLSTLLFKWQLIYFQIKFYLLGISFSVRFGIPLFSVDFWHVSNFFFFKYGHGI